MTKTQNHTTAVTPHHNDRSAHPHHEGRSRLIPVPKWNDYHIWPPIGGLRHLIFHEKTNGFSDCLVRVGRRVLIDEDKFFEWASKDDKQAS